MKQRVFGLIDCNNFFASCERVFDPKLIRKPIAILSNNDGCIIARSSEVKKMGVPMGAPLHEWKDLIERNHVNIYSANFHLYGDMSNRVMQILEKFSPDVQVYSIDEAFIDLTHVKTGDLYEYGKKIRDTIMKWTGLPVSVGIASTKTLSKIAVEHAKKNEEDQGCYVLDSEEKINNYLDTLPVQEIWGIGYRLCMRLNGQGVYTALDFKKLDERKVRQDMSVTVQRTLNELNGIHCIEGVENKETKKQIISSRSFGRRVTSLSELKESVASYVARASEKLRRQGSVASFIGVSVRTNKFAKDEKHYHNSYYMSLETPTDYLADLTKAAHFCLEQIYRKGVVYKKSMVQLGGLVPRDSQKINMFDPEYDTEKNKIVMGAFDQINKEWGSGTIKTAAMGNKQTWKAKSNLRSPRYTTSWEEIVKIKN